MWRVGEMGEGDPKVHIFSCKISARGLMYRIVAIVNNTTSHIESC